MRQIRRNADDRLRRLQRAVQAGDPTAFAHYVNELKRLGRTKDAYKLVYDAMIASGEWFPWPRMRRRITSLERAEQEREYNQALAEAAYEVAVPSLIVEYTPHGQDIENFYFTDSPYVVDFENWQQEAFLAKRVMEGLPPGERGFIPIWRVNTLDHLFWDGVQFQAFDFLKSLGVTVGPGGIYYEGGGSKRVRGGSLELFADGPTIFEHKNGTWTSEVDGFLVRQRVLRLRLSVMGEVLMDDGDDCDDFCALHDPGCEENWGGYCDHLSGHRNACLSDEVYHAQLREYFEVL